MPTKEKVASREKSRLVENGFNARKKSLPAGKYVITRAGKRIGMLQRIRNNLPTFSAHLLYTSYIRPSMEYCNVTWTGCGKSYADSFEKLQRSAARIVMRSNSDFALNCLKWSSLNQRRDNHVSTLVNKCIAGKCPSFFKHYFTMNSVLFGTSDKAIINPKTDFTTTFA